MTDGLLLVDKPQDWTSHDVVARSRRLLATRKVGHAGTLDPMATGVLVLGVGRSTKLLTFLVGCDKDYTATIRLGQATLTDDAEGEVTAAPGAGSTTRDDVLAAVVALTGDIEQVPSAVSAIKVKGERAYHRARAGEAVELPARPVTVARFEVGEARPHEVDGVPVLDVDVEVTVSLRAPTCAPSPATSGPRSAPAGTSRRCAAPGSGASSSPTPTRSPTSRSATRRAPRCR